MFRFNSLAFRFIFILFFCKTGSIFAQAPNISYQTPQTYTTNTAITPLTPNNTGGSVPSNAYGQVSTYAGNRIPTYLDGTSKNASFNYPNGIIVDISGNVYVADDPSEIRKIAPGGIVTTLAGSSQHGSVNGQGPAASFDALDGLAIDASNNIYITDLVDNLIRKVTPAGLVSAFAGSNAPNAGANGPVDGNLISARFGGPFGLVFDSQGNLFISDYYGSTIRKIDKTGQVTTFAGLADTPGQVDGIGSSARFTDPSYLAIDASDNIYVADYNSALRKITPSGMVSTILSGNLNLGTAIALDGSGNVYFTDYINGFIKKINPAGAITTIAGNGIRGFADGLPLTASFNNPNGIALDGSGNLYVADGGNYAIRIISLTGYTIDKPLPAGLTFDPTTGIISGTPILTSPATDYTVTAYNSIGSSSTIVNIAVTNNALPVTQPPSISYQTPQTYTVNAAIAPLTPANTGGAVPATVYGQVSTFAGNGTVGSANGPASASSFHYPIGVAADLAGNLYIGDEVNSLIRKISPAGVVTTLAGSGLQGSANGTGTAASFNTPYGVTVDGAGNVYVADEGNSLIRKITPLGVVTTLAGSGIAGATNGTGTMASFNFPTGVAVDAAGNVYVAEGTNNLVRKITPLGVVTTLAGSGIAGSADGNGIAASFHGPTNIAVDATGNVYVSDSQNNKIRKITPGGIVTTIAGSGVMGAANGVAAAASFNYPYGLTVDGQGNIYVVDQLNNLIRKISATGVVSTLAGTGAPGFVNGIELTASFNNPAGITMDAFGNLYVTDSYNNVVRKIITTGYTIDKPLPEGLNFDPTTGIISGTPINASSPVTYTITAYNIGGSSTTTVNITVIYAQAVTFGAIPTKTTCDADFDPGATGNGPITYTSANPAVATIVSGKIHITGSGTSVITASDGTSSAMETLTVVATPMPTITISPVSLDTCQGAAVTYTATITNGGISPAYQWQVNGQNSGTNSPQFTSSNLNNDDKITCILNSNAVCTTNNSVTSNTVSITIDQPVTAAVSITSTATGPICAGTEVIFTATPTNGGSSPDYQWQVNNQNVGNNSPTFNSSSLADGDFIACILSIAGKCLVNPVVQSNSITISLKPVSVCVITIPNIFTPNGDGINDLWNISALQSYPKCTVNIYTRYGTLIYNSVGYPKAWDGTYNGKALSNGTYFYIIDLKNGKKLAGPVVILR
jgi:gliding motility-associated-like protein